jgi:hypothetical protein
MVDVASAERIAMPAYPKHFIRCLSSMIVVIGEANVSADQPTQSAGHGRDKVGSAGELHRWSLAGQKRHAAV